MKSFCTCFLILVVLLLAAPVWAQGGPPLAYVSTKTGQIWSVDTNTGATKTLVSTGGGYQGLVVAPNNDPLTSAAHPFLVYACNPTGGIIARFDPANPIGPAAPHIVPEIIFNHSVAGAGPKQPQCGRISGGDLIVTDTETGGGWWSIPGIANCFPVANCAGGVAPSPIQLITRNIPAGSVSQGTALKNIGDLLIADHANNSVYRSPGPSYSTESTFISSGLTDPFGISRKSFGQIYVSNQGNLANPSPYIAQFNADGTANPCAGNVTPPNAKTLAEMQMSPGDNLYVAGSTAPVNALNGALFKVDATASNGCLGAASRINLPNSLPPLVGVALALPNFTDASQPLNPANGELANFGYAALQATGVSTCTLTVTATLTPPAVLSGQIAMTAVAGNAVPAVDQGWDGFETVVTPFPDGIDPVVPAGCAAGDSLFHYVLYVDVPSTVTSPLTVFCTTNPPAGCTASDVESVYPFGGPLPSDTGAGGKKPGCTIFTANSTAKPGPGEAATFCLYDPPVNNTFNTITNQQNPAAASVFPVGAAEPAIPFKFSLVKQGTSCKKGQGQFINDAVALLSVLQIADANGNPVSLPIGLNVNGQPLVFVNGSNSYHANWDPSNCIYPSVTEPCKPGMYAATVSFETNNTSFPQTIYTVQTTLIKLQ